MTSMDPRQIETLWSATLTIERPGESSLRSLPATGASTCGGGTSASASSVPGQITRRIVAGGDGPADYRLGEVIGQGGMGTVLSCRQEGVGRTVAMKLVREDHRGDPLVEARFRSEAVLTGALEHPGIVPVYEAGCDQRGRSFLAMKLVSGRAWSAEIAGRPLAENVAILLRVADAVAFAHDRGVVHCDLKPGNVMLGGYGEVLLLDWGLAMRMQDGGAVPLAPDGMIGGTPAYMAPEQASQDLTRIGPATDIYLLGAVLYEIAGGVRPHGGGSQRECLLAAAANRIRPATGDAELLAIARRAMADAPAGRHARIAEFCDDLRGWRTHAGSIALLGRARSLAAAGSLASCAEAMHAIAEARVQWPQVPEADAAEGEVRRAWAGAALQAGDAVLAAAVARRGHPGEDELHAAALARQERQRGEALRVRGLRVALAGLAVALLAGLVLAERRVAREESAAVAARAEAEMARVPADAAALRGHLAGAVAAAAAGDRDGADAHLAAIAATGRGPAWRAVRSLADESIRHLPGLDAAYAVAWADASRLWAGGERELLLLDVAGGPPGRRIPLPHPPTAIACGPAGVLVGLRQGALLAADAGEPVQLPIGAPVDAVALTPAGACLLLSEGVAYRWRRGQAEPERLRDGVVALAAQGEQAVLATRDRVLVDGAEEIAIADGAIQAIAWTDAARLLLVRRGPEIAADGTRGPPVAGLADPVFELRRADGGVLCRAPCHYLARCARITADGTGITLVHARFHQVLTAGAGRGLQRAVLDGDVREAVSAADGTLAVAWAGGVAVQRPAHPAHRLDSSDNLIAVALADGKQGVAAVRCDGAVVELLPEGQRTLRPAGGRHLPHLGGGGRLALLDAGGFAVCAADGPGRLGTDGGFAPLPSDRSPGQILQARPSPGGARCALLTAQGLMLAGSDTAVPTPRLGARPAGWIDDGCLVVSESGDLVAVESDGWRDRWRVRGACGREDALVAAVPGGVLCAIGPRLELRRAANGALVATATPHRAAISALACRDGLILSGDRSGEVVFSMLPELAPLAVVPWSRSPITAVALPRRGGMAIAAEDATTHLWAAP